MQAVRALPRLPTGALWNGIPAHSNSSSQLFFGVLLWDLSPRRARVPLKISYPQCNKPVTKIIKNW